jgi:hypothetical protein
MRFYFDIDESEFEDEYGIDFKRAVFNGVVESIAEDLLSNSTDWSRHYSEVRAQVDRLLKEREKDICEAVIERVADKVAHKKAIVALTPKASELAAADKDNVKYFEEMIDKAIARKFGK